MFERASTVIRDPDKLTFDYVPDTLVHREEQMGLLERYFRPLAESGKACFAFLTGSVGTGKTATATRFCENMRAHCARSGKPINFIMVNCRNRNTESGVLLELVRYFDRGFPDRGILSRRDAPESEQTDPEFLVFGHSAGRRTCFRGRAAQI